MSYNCNDSFCKDGNCPGCKDGVTWCEDPACAPYCSSNCIRSGEDKAFMIIAVIFFLIFGLIVMICYYNNI